MRLRRKTCTFGFSLMELLIVIAIVGILAALLVVGVSRGKEKARQIQCVSNVRQLGQAMQLFIGNSHVYPLMINSGYLEREIHRTFHFLECRLGK